MKAQLLPQLFLGAIALSALAACRGETSRETPIVPIRNMYKQPRYNMQGESAFFKDDGRTMRPQVDGTISRETETDPELAKGRLADNSGYVLTIPKAVVDEFGGMAQLLDRGEQRFGIYCAPCHDPSGGGQGIVVKHGMQVPPTFHQKRIREIPDGQLFATISNGISNMPAYGPQIRPSDRWAIVGHVRALQVSQASVAQKETP